MVPSFRMPLFLALMLGACANGSPDQAVVNAIVYEGHDGKMYVDVVALDEAFNRGNIEAEIIEAARLDLDEPERLLLAMFMNEYGESKMMEELIPWVCNQDEESVITLDRFIAGYTDYVYEC